MQTLWLAAVLLLHAANAHDTDTPVDVMHKLPQEVNQTLADPRDVQMNGHSNYNALQQIFYIYGPLEAAFGSGAANLGRKKDGALLPDGYVVTPGIGAHKLHVRRLNWNRARKACIAEGGHLAIINSDAEEKILLQLLKEAQSPPGVNQSPTRGWLGLHDFYEEGDWVTVLDEPFEKTGFTRWTGKYKVHQPDDAFGGQDCAALESEGGIDDTGCDSLIAYFCEISF